MKLHWIQHVPFEGLGHIEKWAVSRNADITCTRLYASEQLPEMEAFDWLVIMGGPMGIYDHQDYPWLKAEKELIIQAVHAGKTILGVCLGAQLIADALGAKVYSGPHKEIGWFPIQCFNSDLIWPENQLTVFHWHGDTFDLPKGAKRIASSAACKNQAFIVKDRILGLQFHMETTLEGIETLIENCGHELVEAPFIQTPKEMRSGAVNIKSINCALEHLLDSLPR